MGAPLEIGRVHPVNSTTTSEQGFSFSAVGDKYKPRAIEIDTTHHEAIHAGTTSPDNIVLVTNIPDDVSNGKVIMKRPDAVAKLAPHAVKQRGTTFDYMTSGAGADGKLSAARGAVQRNHAEIIEIADVLGERGLIGETEVREAREKARLKKMYGTTATFMATAPTGEKMTVKGAAVEGDKAKVPDAIQAFSARVKERMDAEAAQKRAAQEQAIKAKEQELAKISTYDIQSPRTWSRVKPESNGTPAKVGHETEQTNTQEGIDIVLEAEAILNEEAAKAQKEKELASVRAELAQLQDQLFASSVSS